MPDIHVPPAGVYVDIPLGRTGLGLYPHEPPPQQVVYLAYTPPNHGLYVLVTSIIMHV